MEENATPFHKATKIKDWLLVADTDGSMIWKNTRYNKETKTIEKLDYYGRVINTIKL